MDNMEMIIEHIRRYVDFYDIIPITGGYSGDKKYLCRTKTGEKKIIRVTISDDPNVLISGKKQFELIQQLRHYSSLVPKPYDFLISDDHGFALMILEYIDGEDGEVSLKALNADLQYEIGYRAGVELKNLHQLVAPPDYPSWSFLKWRKYEWYWNEYQKNPLDSPIFNLNAIDSFIRKHQYLINNVCSTFQHDDFHPANLIIRNGHLNGIIDFNRCDYGDPIHDFYKVAFFSRNISIPFSRGQVDGYFLGTIPADFWIKYTFYVAMSIISDLVWSDKYDRRTGSCQELRKSIHRISTICQDHDECRSVIPGWYNEG